MKRATEVKENGQNWSPRSQQSLLQERELQGKLDAVRRDTRRAERDILELEESKADLVKRSLANDPARTRYEGPLHEVINQLRTKKDLLEIYGEQRTHLEAAIAALTPSPAQREAQAEQQKRLAGLAVERLEKDWLADKMVASLRQFLQDRAALTAKMSECAGAIEFTTDENGLDAQRFDALLAALPEGLGTESERWADWFFGKRKNVTRYIVCDERLVVAESLAHHGIHRFGDSIELTEEEAHPLLREDRPAPTHDEPWRCAPPSVTTVEAFEAAVAEAAEMDAPVEDIFAARFFKRHKEVREQYLKRHNEQAARENADFQAVYTRGQ